jgi:hypothetical protein
MTNEITGRMKTGTIEKENQNEIEIEIEIETETGKENAIRTEEEKME